MATRLPGTDGVIVGLGAAGGESFVVFDHGIRLEGSLRGGYAKRAGSPTWEHRAGVIALPLGRRAGPMCQFTLFESGAAACEWRGTRFG